MKGKGKARAVFIPERRRAEQTVKDARDYAESIVNTVREPMLVLDAELRVITASRSFLQTFQVQEQETRGQLVYDLGNGQWNIPSLRKLLEEILPTKKAFDDFEMEHDFENLGQRIMVLNARHIPQEDHNEEMVLLAIEDITDQKHVEDALRTLNEDLDQRVSTRTAELTAANMELEAFAYSVSHDLRAPLRSIDGFSKALLEDYQDKLDDTGRDHLNRVRAGTERMGQLIDDLLKLSRLTRSEMRHQSVDLSEMARNIAGELRGNGAERRVDLVFPGGITASGDRALLEAVLENLLGNAWKFTGPRQHARIEFGVTERNGERIYYVQDDGVGFEMAYAHKLFGAFQRLHSDVEFPGSGIGLAIVQRVILRHGGRIWAEAEVDRGATFYFTLPTVAPESDDNQRESES